MCVTAVIAIIDTCAEVPLLLNARVGGLVCLGWADEMNDHLIIDCPHLQVSGKAVLITGCDTGFGHALAKHLHKLGFTVFAGCLLKVRK